MTEFDRLKMKDTDKIDDFIRKLSEISSKSDALGETMDEYKLVKKFLQSIPWKKYHIVASLEQILNLKITCFEDIIGQLKTYEERICDEENETQENQRKLMYANMEAQSQWDYHRNRKEEVVGVDITVEEEADVGIGNN